MKDTVIKGINIVKKLARVKLQSLFYFNCYNLYLNWHLQSRCEANQTLGVAASFFSGQLINLVDSPSELTVLTVKAPLSPPGGLTNFGDYRRDIKERGQDKERNDWFLFLYPTFFGSAILQGKNGKFGNVFIPNHIKNNVRTC